MGDLDAAVQTGLLDPAQGTDFMDDLAGVARQFATDALGDAQGGDPVVIADAELALSDGDTLRAAGTFKDAVAEYGVALADAESLL